VQVTMIEFLISMQVLGLTWCMLASGSCTTQARV